MTDLFGKYADYYDLFYQEKDYIFECDILELLFNKYLVSPVRSIINLGCGTGNHDIIMAGRGYNMTGIDVSQAMLKIARKKAIKNKVEVRFFRSDVRKYHPVLNKADAVISMFAVVSYQVENRDLYDLFKATREYLNIGGLFVFDGWFGPGVLADRPQNRLLEIKSPGKTILRYAVPDMNALQHQVTVRYRVLQLEGETVRADFDEEHKMRFLFLPELEWLSQLTGFRLLAVFPFGQPDQKLTEKHWTFQAVAQAI